MFIAGADLKELGRPARPNRQSMQLVQRGLESSAGSRSCLFRPSSSSTAPAWGAAGTALGFDYRLAGNHPKVEIGCPEAKIGLIPGWGGTQR